MSTLQDWVYQVEAGSVRLWLVRLALFLVVAGLASWIGLREFNGLRTMEAMDLAQQARQLAHGKGFTTQMIRPLALWQLRAKDGSRSPGLSEFPETLSPPLYPVLLAGAFRLGELARWIDFKVPEENVKTFRIYTPDYIPLILNLCAVVLSALFVFLWGAKQFDLGAGVLAAVFFLGTSALWDFAIQGGPGCLLVLLYGAAGWMFSHVLQERDESESSPGVDWRGLASFLAGVLIGSAPLIQVIQIWGCLAFVVCGLLSLRENRWTLLLGALIPFGVLVLWMGKLWMATGNPLGLNWAYFLSDSAHYPGNMVWRTFSFDRDKIDVWRRVIGSGFRGLSMILRKGPDLCGNTIAGILAVACLLHHFKRDSASKGRNVWGLLGFVLLMACSFVYRGEEGAGSPILIVLLPFACVYGAAFLWILIDRWKFEIDLLGKLVACAVSLLACWPVVARMMLPEPPPFSYPPNYPPIFIFMRSWFEPRELQASDIPWAEAWYTDAPTLWIPATREDFLKIHDRVAPVFSILFTPVSSDVKMYSQMLGDDSEWSSWADLIRRQKPPDLPQAFITSLPPNNDYLLLSLQKRWR